MKKTLLCLMQLPPPVHGVTAINSSVEASALLSSKFDVEVVPLRFSESIDDLRRITARKAVATLAVTAKLLQSLRANRPAAVYFTLTPHGGGFYRDCLFVGIIRACNVRRVFHLHGKGVASALRSRWRRALYRWVFQDAWVIHVAPSLTADIAGLVDASRVIVVPNGIADVSSAQPHHVPRAVPRVLFLSHMTAKKGPVTLVRVLHVLRQRGIDFEATFAGSGSAIFIEEFKRTVAELALGDRVRYVGPVYERDKEKLFSEHDVFAYPTEDDAFPLVLLEAMQHRLPIVANAVGGIPDMIADEDNGLLVRAGDIDAFADKLTTLLCNAERRRELGDAARRKYLAAFTLESFEQNLVGALLRCTS
jgi:glycosyltransferase involved in cell wall biosynthesis